MGFATIITSIIFVAIKVLSVCSSIHFDEVEFHNPSSTLDQTDSNGLVCVQLGDECNTTDQCCGVGVCKFPFWWTSSICVLPDSKYEKRFRTRFFSLHNLRPEDIRYIRDSYNTSQYDFLLTDLTFSAPPLNNTTDDESSSEIMSENLRVHNDTVEAFDDLAMIHSRELNFSENLAGNFESTNDSLLEIHGLKLELNSSLGLDSHYNIDDRHFLNEVNFSRPGTTNSSLEGDYSFRKHFMFLLINSTLGQHDSNLNDFYDQIINTDRFKFVIQQLRERLRVINEIEKNFSNNNDNNTENSTDFINKIIEINKPTIEKTQTTKKLSNWNIVKKFIFHNRASFNETNNSNNDTKKNRLVKLVHGIIPKETQKAYTQENAKEKIKFHPSYRDNTHDTEGLNKLIEDVDKIEDIIDGNRIMNALPISKNVNDEDLIDFYNIDVPLSSFDKVLGKPKRMNNSLENVFKDIGDTVNNILTENNNFGREEQNKLKIEKYNQENKIMNISKENQSNIDNSAQTLNKTHFWNNIHFWRVPFNLSTGLEKNIKNFFFSTDRSSSSGKQNNLKALNEDYLHHFNSKITQKTLTPLQTQRTPEHFSYSSSSEIGSQSSSTEELYNNSYVFIVNQGNLESPVKLSSWKKVLNFFHKERGVPISLDLNVNDNPAENHYDTENLSYKVSESDPSIDEVPEIIRLPEHLMPQALDQRQGNETDWIFESSEDLEESIIEEHKSSNSSFFIFFKEML